MPNIFDYVSAKEIALYIKNLPQESTLDKQLFPADKQYGMEIELAKGAKQKPVALTVHLRTKKETLLDLANKL